MTDIDRLTRAIQALADATGGFDAGNFVSNLIASGMGAGIAALVSWLILRRERGDKYEETIREGVRRAVELMLKFADDAAASRLTHGDASGIPVTAELMLLESTARGADKTVISAVGQRFQEVSHPDNWDRDFHVTALVVYLVLLIGRERPPAELARFALWSNTQPLWAWD